MLSETIQLEKLRQKIEDAETLIGDRTDYHSYGKPNPAQAKQAQALIEKLKVESKAARAELSQWIETLRSQKPQAIEEWVDYHAGVLRKIVSEDSKDANAKTRKYVAQETIENWEKVRRGELEYVNINWHFLKDYKAFVRSIDKNSKTNGSNQAITNQKNPEGKAWWEFWKQD